MWKSFKAAPLKRKSLDHLPHELWPVFTRLSPNDDLVAFVGHAFDAFVVHQDDDAVEELLGEQDVVASAKNEMLLFLIFRSAEKPIEFSRVVDLYEIFRCGVEAEAVVRLEVDVCFHDGKDTESIG